MHLFPYIDSLWFGEGYDYNEEPDYWLVEVSGIPFGLMGDMMREGNVWRGMLYGMTTRFRCADPSALWRLWDSFGISSAEMYGWWNASLPVRVACANEAVVVKATAFVHSGKDALVVLASFGTLGGNCTLEFDWRGMDLPEGGHGFHLRAAKLMPMQPTEEVFEIGAPTDVPSSTKGRPAR